MALSRFVQAMAILSALVLAGCAGSPAAQPPDDNASIANPASQFCAGHNGMVRIVDGPGGQHGVCVFGNGAMCEEWAYMRGECGMEKPNYCGADADCACGVHATTRECFFGQMEFVDAGEQCPDFCNGIAAHLEIKCVKNQCEQVRKEAAQEK
jgi:hypothetical protein